MLNRKKGIEKFPLVLILLLLPLLVIPATVFAGESDKKIEGEAKGKAEFVLTIKDGLISLNAKDASLKKIIDEIGSSMKIDVIGNIPEEEKISVGFDKLSLKEALEKLSSNYGYLMDSERGEKEDHSNKLQITKIIILPKGEETETPKFTAKESTIQDSEDKETKRPEPFKFEFDPSEFMK